MRSLLIASVLLAFVASAVRPKWNQLEGYSFDEYHTDFKRQYAKGGDEYQMRETIFNRKLADMIAHNKNPEYTWKRGVNMFTDMTAEEWKNYNKAFKSPHRPAPTMVHGHDEKFPLPKQVDYRTWNSPQVLTAVKHQGSCGSCWAFSATETLEAYYSLATGKLPVLAIQQVLSCTQQVYGCGGGDATLGWEYVQKNSTGLTEEWAYPYTNFFFNNVNPHNSETHACRNITKEYPATPYTWFAELTEVSLDGYNAVTPNNASAAMDALATRGPLSISVAAGNWQDYEVGVMSNTNSTGLNNEWAIDHAVQMVGYGYDKELDKNYWIVRNSWSTLWGEAGYVRLDRPDVEPCAPRGDGFGPTCGTSGCLNDPHYPNVKPLPGRKF